LQGPISLYWGERGTMPVCGKEQKLGLRGWKTLPAQSTGENWGIPKVRPGGVGLIPNSTSDPAKSFTLSRPKNAATKPTEEEREQWNPGKRRNRKGYNQRDRKKNSQKSGVGNTKEKGVTIRQGR